MFIKSTIALLLLFAGNAISMSEGSTSDPKNDCRLVEERNLIKAENFTLMCVRPSMVDDVAPTVGDKETMKLYGDGSVWPKDRLEQSFYRRAISMFNKATVPDYIWAIATKEGICGLVMAIKRDDEYEITYILDKKVHGRGLAQKAVEKVLHFLPEHAFQATAHPDNVASCKVLTNACFKLLKTEMHLKYHALRNYYARPSEDSLENEEFIYFTYSRQEIRLKLLSQ